MRFFGREQEIADLRKVRELSRTFSRFTVVTGRRRVGKTQLLRMALDDGESPYVHLVITRKPEKVQCEAHQAEIERVLGLAIPYAVPRFSQLFEMVMKQSIHQPLTLVLDEFQEFDHVDPGLFGEIAAVWDRYHNEAKVNLVVCGSVNRLIFKIFFDDHLVQGNIAVINLKILRLCVPVYSVKAVIAGYGMLGGKYQSS